MNKLHFKKNINKLIFILTLSILPISQLAGLVKAETQYVKPEEIQIGIGETLQEKLARLERELNDIKNQKSNLQKQLDSNTYTISGYNSQISKLYGEAELYKKDIDQLKIEIEQLELNIAALNEKVEQKKTEIKRSEDTIVELSKESDLRIKNSYMNFRMYGNNSGGSTIFVIDNVNSYFKDSQYKELIQSETNSLMSKLAQLKQQLADKKKELDEQLVLVKKDKEIVEVKKVDLDKKKEEVDIKIATYQAQVNILNSKAQQAKSSIQAFSSEEIRKNAEAERVRQEIFNSFKPVGAGEYVVTGKYIGRQGSTGWSTGPHLHFSVQINNGYQNPCAFLAGGVCGGNGQLQWPLNPVSYFTSGYGNRCFSWNGSTTCDFHSGIDLVGNVWNAPIYAAHNGYLHKGVDSYGALYIIICENANCSQGIKTGYWHLSQY